jgi:hypothetical protein
MKTPNIDKCLKLIKNAKTDNEIKKAISQLGSDAQWCSSVGNECTEYSALCEDKGTKNEKN